MQGGRKNFRPDMHCTFLAPQSSCKTSSKYKVLHRVFHKVLFPDNPLPLDQTHTASAIISRIIIIARIIQ